MPKTKDIKSEPEEVTNETVFEFTRQLSEKVDTIIKKLKTPGTYDVSEEIIEANKLYFDVLCSVEVPRVRTTHMFDLAMRTWKDYKEARVQYTKLLKIIDEYNLKDMIETQSMKKKTPIPSVILLLSQVKEDCRAILKYCKK